MPPFMKSYIKSKSGRVLGWIQSYNTNFLAAYNISGRCIGRYDIRNDKTYDVSGRLLYNGNTLSALIIVSELNF